VTTTHPECRERGVIKFTNFSVLRRRGLLSNTDIDRMKKRVHQIFRRFLNVPPEAFEIYNGARKKPTAIME
jgi:hypothetical protein